jgi:molybdopterin synthase sulfur carrier subunit
MFGPDESGHYELRNCQYGPLDLRGASSVPRVFIPPLLRPLTGGAEDVEIEGTNVRQLIEDLELRFPGIRDRLCEGDDLKPGLRAAVDGRVSSMGLLEKVREGSEVHFLPAVGGG